jgi:threonine/homoserine/homoserine lactone efflux protein
MDDQPNTRGLRASDADREAVVGRLQRAATEGRLDPDELEERLTATYASKYCSDLDGLVADITPPAAAPAPVASRPVFVAPRRQTNPLAVVSLVTSMVWMWWFGSVAAIVCGHVALRQINRSGGRQGGRGLAVGGLVIGYLSVLIAALVLLISLPWH